MYKQSNEAKLAYQSAERTLDIVVNINGVDYKATDIEQFDYDSGGYTGDTFSIGSTYENNITVKFIHLVEGLNRGMIVKPRIGIKLPNGTFEYTPLGVFIIADEIQMDRNNNSTTIKAYDKFVVMEGQYVSKLTYPANAVDIITEIAQMCKVDVNTNDLAHLPTIKVSKAITKQSYRTAIGWIAQLYVGFASFDRDGKLTIRRVAEPNYTIEPSEYEQQGLVKNEAPYIIGGISCNVNVVETTNNGETNETTHKIHSGSVNGSQIELTNDIMTQSLLDSIWDSLKTITFYPFSLNWFGNPAIEAGDWLSLKDMKGNVFVVPNNGYTISFNGGLSSTSKADQNATDSSTVKYTGELTRAIENYSRRQAPDGTNIYTDVKEPTDAKFNDVWFKPNGNSTELWIFERQSDGTGKWVKQPVNGEVEQKINDALKDFDELDKSFKDNANTQSATNELMKSRIDSISNQIPNLSDEISRVNGSVTSLKTQTDKDRQQLQSTSQNLDKARQDVLSNSSRIDKLSVGLDSVNINVNNVNSKVDNIKIGGTNLMQNTTKDYVKFTGNGWGVSFMTLNNQPIDVSVEGGETYTFSAWVKNDSSSAGRIDLEIYQYNAKEENNLNGSSSEVSAWVSPGEEKRLVFTKTLLADTTRVRLHTRNRDKNGTVTYWTKMAQVEKGTIATDWSPAPEDEIERVSQLRVDLDGLSGTVANNKGDIAQIKLTENGMQQSIKDAQGNISTLQNDSKQFKQQFQDVNGNIITIKNDAKSLSSQLSTKVGTSEYSSFKEQTAQELRTKLIASDLSGYAKSADVKVSVDGLNARFDNLNVGGTNLLRKTSNEWKTWTGTGWANDTVDNGPIDLEPGTYTFRAEIDNTGNSQKNVKAEIYVESKSKNMYDLASYYHEEIVEANSKGYVKATFTIKTPLERVRIRPHTVVGGVLLTTTTIKWRKEKLEQGTVATDWSPSPEDIDNKIEVLSGKVTANSNEFSTVYTKITNAKNDAINTIKGDSQWQSMGKIVTNASFLQNANGFAQEVVKTTTPMISGGGVNLLKDSLVPLTTSNIWMNDGVSNQVLDDYVRMRGTGDNNRIYQPFSNNGLNADGYYSISFWASNDNNNEEFDVQVGTWNSLQTVHITTGAMKQYKVENVWLGGNSSFSFVAPFNKIVRLKKLKLEKGTIATDWSPSPEDLATKLQLNQVIDTADSHTRTITDYLTGSNSRFVQMANYLNMNVGSSSVSINGDGIMLSGNRIKITGKTLIDNAVILDALIKDINANTVKTKELDASKINVTNLNANNITSGTISGTNLNINLDSGDVSFQKGRIHDSNNYIDINIDQRYISTSNLFTRVILKNGKMQLMDQKLFDITDDYYFEISNEGKGGTQWLTGATLLGKNSVFLGTKNGAANGSVTEASPMGQTKSSGISVDDYQPTLITGSSRGVMIKGGETFRLATGDTTPYISVGTGQGGISKNRIIIDADYVHFPSVNLKTTSSSPNVYVASDGALVRSTSASKYKSDISRTHDMDYGNKLLELPVATWIDKAEFERYAKKESEQPPIRHFGMIAEDLADVGLEMLVTRNESGELEGIQYDRIAPALIPVIADLKRRLENLERKQQTNE